MVFLGFYSLWKAHGTGNSFGSCAFFMRINCCFFAGWIFQTTWCSLSQEASILRNFRETVSHLGVRAGFPSFSSLQTKIRPGRHCFSPSGGFSGILRPKCFPSDFLPVLRHLLKGTAGSLKVILFTQKRRKGTKLPGFSKGGMRHDFAEVGFLIRRKPGDCRNGCGFPW